MRLVPRQLQIHGLTGDVPYFGGRLTPAQAYAAARPQPPGAGPAQGAPPGLAPVGGPRGAVPPVPVAGRPQDAGPIPGVPSSVPQAAPLQVPSTLQPTQAPGFLAPATARPVPGAAPPGAAKRPESQRAIQQLLLAGVITTTEADQLAGRLG